ncbi:RES domain-containing protein [Massilia sp. RP-1-19]|uniref:RES domain-containing protein n=1 Tax=Massilia polaris TaxID=2728846 RepID=A0A848HN12_9BURK|nr:RES domain-containing protein [Massilia polaris]NML62594.1 RES domain-containing protein [Massilia polaris]
MRLWRIEQRKYALDKRCIGTTQFGGRWNPVGSPALYSSTSISLCALEKFVHLGFAPLPPLVLIAVDIPDSASIYVPNREDLPAGWDTLPTSRSAQAFGGAWIAAVTELAMKVPSVVVPEENNVVLNARHATYNRVRLSVAREFSFDKRLFEHA